VDPALLAVLLLARFASMDERLAALLEDLKRAESLSAADVQRCARRSTWFNEFSPAQFAEFLTGFASCRSLPRRIGCSRCG
jgi:hypothetical protein